MPRIYLNQSNKERSATLFVLLTVFDYFKNQEKRSKELFGTRGWGWLKISRSFLKKSLAAFAENIGPDEWSKVEKLAKHSDFVVMTRNVKPGAAELVVKEDALHDLAELAMGRNCFGCTKCDWKLCKELRILQAADIPAAQEVKNDCPYRQ